MRENDKTLLLQTTLERYLAQLAILEDLEKQVSSDGVTVEKEYVKGRCNLYINPAIVAYNKTAAAANNTIATLLNIIREPEEIKTEHSVAFLEIMNEKD